MGLLDRISYTVETVKKQRDDQELKRALALKELRDKVIPMFQRLIDKYKAEVKYLDTDAYVFVVENGKERGIYIPYTTDEIHLDLKLDTFVHDYTSASKHKMRAKLEQSLDRLENDNKKKGGLFEGSLDLKNFDTSLKRRY